MFRVVKKSFHNTLCSSVKTKYSTIQSLLVERPSAAITWSNHFVYDLNSLTSCVAFSLFTFCGSHRRPRPGLCHCNVFICFFFSHPVKDLLSLGSLFCCKNKFQPNFGDWLPPLPDSRIQGFVFLITPPSLWLTVDMRCLCWNVVVGFHKPWWWPLWPNTSMLVSCKNKFLKDVVPDSWWSHLLTNQSNVLQHLAAT